MSLVSSTFIQAIKNNYFISWPGLTTELIARNLPKSIATIQGYLKSERQGLQSTKIILISKEEQKEIDNDYFLPSQQPNI